MARDQGKQNRENPLEAAEQPHARELVSRIAASLRALTAHRGIYEVSALLAHEELRVVLKDFAVRYGVEGGSDVERAACVLERVASDIGGNEARAMLAAVGIGWVNETPYHEIFKTKQKRYVQVATDYFSRDPRTIYEREERLLKALAQRLVEQTYDVDLAASSARIDRRSGVPQYAPFDVIDRRQLSSAQGEPLTPYLLRLPRWSDVVHGHNQEARFIERECTEQIVDKMTQLLGVASPSEDTIPALFLLGAPGAGKSTLLRRAAAMAVERGQCIAVDFGLSQSGLQAPDATRTKEALRAVSTELPLLLLLDDILFSGTGWPDLLAHLARPPRIGRIAVLGATPTFLFERFSHRLPEDHLAIQTFTVSAPTTSEIAHLRRFYPSGEFVAEPGDDLLGIAVQLATGSTVQALTRRLWKTLNDGAPIAEHAAPADVAPSVIAFLVTCWLHRFAAPFPIDLLAAVLREAQQDDGFIALLLSSMDSFTTDEGWSIFRHVRWPGNLLDFAPPSATDADTDTSDPGSDFDVEGAEESTVADEDELEDEFDDEVFEDEDDPMHGYVTTAHARIAAAAWETRPLRQLMVDDLIARACASTWGMWEFVLVLLRSLPKGDVSDGFGEAVAAAYASRLLDGRLRFIDVYELLRELLPTSPESEVPRLVMEQDDEEGELQDLRARMTSRAQRSLIDASKAYADSGRADSWLAGLELLRVAPAWTTRSYIARTLGAAEMTGVYGFAGEYLTSEESRRTGELQFTEPVDSWFDPQAMSEVHRKPDDLRDAVCQRIAEGVLRLDPLAAEFPDDVFLVADEAPIAMLEANWESLAAWCDTPWIAIRILMRLTFEAPDSGVVDELLSRSGVNESSQLRAWQVLLLMRREDKRLRRASAELLTSLREEIGIDDVAPFAEFPDGQMPAYLRQAIAILCTVAVKCGERFAREVLEWVDAIPDTGEDDMPWLIPRARERLLSELD